MVVLTGSRQTGKTTLVRHLLPAAGGPESVYFTLDDPDERLRLGADPVRRLDHGRRLVILDEVQKQPALLDAVKFLADRGRPATSRSPGVKPEALLIERHHVDVLPGVPPGPHPRRPEGELSPPAQGPHVLAGGRGEVKGCRWW